MQITLSCYKRALRSSQSCTQNLEIRDVTRARSVHFAKGKCQRWLLALRVSTCLPLRLGKCARRVKERFYDESFNFASSALIFKPYMYICTDRSFRQRSAALGEYCLLESYYYNMRAWQYCETNVFQSAYAAKVAYDALLDSARKKGEKYGGSGKKIVIPPNKKLKTGKKLVRLAGAA